jgi:hypothetical protein
MCSAPVQVKLQVSLQQITCRGEESGWLPAHTQNISTNETSAVVESNIFIAGLSEIDRLLYNWRIFLTYYIGGYLPPYDSQISAVIYARIIRIHI